MQTLTLLHFDGMASSINGSSKAFAIEVFATIATQHLDKLVHFYHNILEQPPHRQIPQVYAEFRLPGFKLGIFCPKIPASQSLRSTPDAGISLCFEVADLEVAIARLTQLGYPPTGEVMLTSHGREIYAHDPDGNSLILHQGNGMLS